MMKDFKNICAVILAGGKGKRLLPYTTIIPKPLFPILDKAIIQIIIEQLHEAGIGRIIISLGYLGELIKAYLNDGKRFGVDIEYVVEGAPLGTAGCLSLIKNILPENFICMNGDILATVDFVSLVDYHIEKKSVLTICTYKKEDISSLGVLSVDGYGRVNNYFEKPQREYIVSSGIYVMNQAALEFVPFQEHLDMPDLVLKLIAAKKDVLSRPLEGAWFDIGTPGDLEEAIRYYQAFFKKP